MSEQADAVAVTRKPITISDVAAAAGVSKSMVSYALNNRPGVKEATRQHIVETARELGWTPNVRGRALSASKAYAIGLVFEQSAEALATDQYYLSLMAGLQSVLSPVGYSLVTEIVEGHENERSAFEQLARDGRVDGLVLTDFADDDPRIDVAIAAGLAVVAMGRPERTHGMPNMRNDETDALTAVIDHLVALGHTRVGQVAGPQGKAAARRRRETYQRLLREHGLDDSMWLEGDFSAAAGQSRTAQLLLADPAPTAIVYGNDLMAIAGMSAAMSAGLRVPEDISIVGWDDIGIAEWIHPALSTIATDPFRDGAEAARVLLAAIDGTRWDAPIEVDDPVWIPRGSTGPAPA